MAKTINNMHNKASHRFRAAALSGMRFFALSTPVFLNACGGSSDSASTASTPQNASGTATAAAASGSQLSPAAGLGQKIFSDQTLSASGRQSCASCHDPAAAHAQTDQSAVQLGGTQLDTPGFRSVPSLRYLNLTPAFFFAADGTPTGGFNRDGRAQTLAQRAQRPVMAAHERATEGREELIGHLGRAAYAEEF